MSLRAIAISVVAALAGCAQVSPATDGSEIGSQGDAAQVIDLERSYWAAEQRKDWAALERMLAPEYRSMSSRGGPDRSKAEELALLSGGRVDLESFTFSTMRATWLSRDMVALNYIVDQRFHLDGRTLCPRSGSMTIWKRGDDGWLRTARTEYRISPESSIDCASVSPSSTAQPRAPVATATTEPGWIESRHVPGIAFRPGLGKPSQPGPFRYLMRAAAGTAIGVHRHSADMQIRVTEGRKFMLVGDPPEGQPVRIVEAGETITIPAGTWHVEWWEAETLEEISGVGPMRTERPPEVVPRRP